MKKVSICMTHYNRKRQLLNTLQSIQNQEYKDFVEIIIVDDVSNEPLQYKDFEDFELDIKLVSVQTKNKWWVNPCVGFNTAFNFIDSPITIIQNAECLHATNVLEYVINHLPKNQYVAMCALSLSEASSTKINRNTNIAEIDTSNSSWYCHPQARPQPFNFCAAIHTEDLRRVGGFDSRFSKGIYYDDDAFLHKLRSSSVECQIEDSQVVYHQWHEQIWESLTNKHELGAINRELLHSL
jgi:glycosyltransferase involved in cell wall biosynthesis